MRGPAPSSRCPRCGAEAPPTGERLAHCATCKLAFDPTSEPVARPLRRRDPAGEPTPRGLEIRRAAGEVSLVWSYERLHGVAYLLIGVVCAAMLLGNLGTPGERVLDLVLLGAATAFSLYVGCAQLFGDTTLLVDARQLLVRHGPLPLRRRVWIGRAEIEGIEVRHSSARSRPWIVAARTPRGLIEIAEFQAGNAMAEQAAECVAEVVLAALDELTVD